MIKTFLSNAFLVHRLERYDLIRKRVLEIGEQYYFGNPGQRNVIIGYYPTNRAKLLENLVYSHLLYGGYAFKVGNWGNQEIDFCVRKRQREDIFPSGPPHR